MTRVLVNGASGRMGRAVLKAVIDSLELTVAGGVGPVGSSAIGMDLGVLAGSAAIDVYLTDSIQEADVCIDFSSPAGLRRLLREFDGPIVSGTTGGGPELELEVDEASKQRAIVFAPNMSPGVTVLTELARRAAELLGPDYDAELVEMHHRRKRDAPSGTALRLAKVIAGAKGLGDEALCFGRSGQLGPRPNAEIGVMTLRGGDVIGDHTVVFAGPEERVELTHRAHSRSVFAEGAVRAARFVVRQPAGRYGMREVMGL